MNDPTPYPDVNTLLKALLENVRAVLGSHFIGMYLEGSLAGEGFDQDSDIDFVVVTSNELTDEQFQTLQAMHDRLAGMDSPWAIQMEGFYLSAGALRRYDPGAILAANIERGQGERLKKVRIDPGWEIHRYILRERGIPIAGPAPKTLIEPVLPDQLRQAVRFILSGWAEQFLIQPGLIEHRGYQSYIVLSLCRILYTLEFGDVASKRAAARWAQDTLDPRRAGLVERAWDGRRHPGENSSHEEIEDTLEFIRYTLERAGAGGTQAKPANRLGL